MGVVDEHLARRFLVLYGPPDSADPLAFVDEYVKALEGTDADILREALDLVVKQHKYPRIWPSVGDCTDMVRSVADRRMAARRREAWGYAPEKRIEPSPEEKARVDAIAQRVKAALAQADEPVRVARPPTDRDSWAKMLETSEIARHFAQRRGGAA